MNTLTRLAFTGTAQAKPTDLSGSSEVDALVPASAVEEQVLLLAGARGLYEQAGSLPVENLAVPSAVEGADRAIRSSKLIHLVRQVLENKRYDLLSEYAHTLKRQQRHLPYEVLPEVLEMADAGLRQQLLPVLGPRGIWLSQFNPRWAWVSQGVASVTEQDRSALKRAWEEGKLAQRLLALNIIRKSDAVEGRRWLEEAWSKEKADARATLLEGLQTGLSAADEPLLETLLDDRSEQVRQQAAALLMQLPDSAFAGRMQARAMDMVQGELPTLKLHPPEELSREWIRDGISNKTPAGRSKRGYWLETVISAVPVTFWTALCRGEPARFLQAIKQAPFAEDMVQGLTRSIQVHADDSAAVLSWVHALWNDWLLEWQSSKKKSQTTLSCMVALLKRLPATTAEQQVLPFLVLGRIHTDALMMLLDVLPRPWSMQFSMHYLQLARHIVKTGVLDQAHEWAKSLEMASRSLPRGVLGAALSPWELREPASWTGHALKQLVERFIEQVQLRKLFYEELEADTPP